jgi:GNAT superfamily N-acetyltransferase
LNTQKNLPADQPKAIIRAARVEDCVSLAQLTNELDHPTTPEVISDRFKAAFPPSNYALFVAELSSGDLAGFIELVVERLIDAEPRVDVAGLVVGKSSRGLGIGRMLMDRAERWAIGWGCRIVLLRTNLKRAGAHAFYERIGYEHIKTQKTFRKILH